MSTQKLQPCPQCGEIPTVAQTCGKFFILSISKPVGVCICSSFIEKRSSERLEIKVWNRHVDAINAEIRRVASALAIPAKEK